MCSMLLLSWSLASFDHRKGSCATSTLCNYDSKNRPNVVLHESTEYSQFLKTTAAELAGCARAFKTSGAML